MSKLRETWDRSENPLTWADDVEAAITEAEATIAMHEHNYITMEKRLCAILGKEWFVTGMSCHTLLNEAEATIEQLKEEVRLRDLAYSKVDDALGQRNRMCERLTRERDETLDKVARLADGTLERLTRERDEAHNKALDAAAERVKTCATTRMGIASAYYVMGLKEAVRIILALKEQTDDTASK